MWWLALAALAAPLTLDEVLDSAARSAPIAEAEAKRDATAGKALAARGAFDPVAAAKLGGYAGDYEREVFEASVGGATLLGPTWTIGHRLGAGDFPSYDDRKTADGGEAYARLALPLLDGLVFPEARTDLLAADATARAADASVAWKRIEIRAKAASAYWKWVAAGEKVAVAERQVGLAEARQRSLARQVAEGARPEIDLIDNERVIAERRALLAAARRDLEIAAVALSLWIADEAGRRVVPDPSRLPALDVEPAVAPGTTDPSGRPDVVALEHAREVAVAEQTAARSRLLPDVVASAELIRPLAASDPTEAVFGATVKVPVPSRKERGTARAAAADLTSAEARLDWARRLADADVDAAIRALTATDLEVAAAREAAERARRLVTLEQVRVDLGAADLFQLLLREDSLAKAEKEVVDALLARRLGEVGLELAVGTAL